MLKNVELNDKWWIELIKTINYLRNRFSMTNKSITFFEIDTRRKFSFVHLRQIETINYVMKRKSITKWKKLASRSFSIVLMNYEKTHIYKMLRLNEIIYRVSFVIWIKKRRKNSIVEASIEASAKKQVIEQIESSAKKQAIESNFVIIFMSISQLIQSFVKSIYSVFSAEIDTLSESTLFIFCVLSAFNVTSSYAIDLTRLTH
jgi:hypothetical protein